jgi:protein tyrosine phosphatase (PTP) superfamily phosphohydrolase (DUF442 family)
MLPIILFLLAAGWAGEGQVVAKAEDAVRGVEPRKVAAEHLPNAYQIHSRVISGGLPEGEAAFRELSELGVKTIVSVDGATPDVATAKKFGMRYVHLPHGYDGIPKERVKQLARAVRDLPGPIYIHCHHGKHRSPAAAAVGCVGAGLLNAEAAETLLKMAGTSEGYRGLYQSAREARRLDDKLLDQVLADFPEKVTVPPLAELMVMLEHTHDHLKLIAAADWKSPREHPDLDPAHEALLLREHFTELLRLDAVQSKPAEFRRYLTDSEEVSKGLESELRGGASREKIAAAFARISKACTDCHQRFRDVPLAEKRM